MRPPDRYYIIFQIWNLRGPRTRYHWLHLHELLPNNILQCAELRDIGLDIHIPIQHNIMPLFYNYRSVPINTSHSHVDIKYHMYDRFVYSHLRGSESTPRVLVPRLVLNTRDYDPLLEPDYSTESLSKLCYPIILDELNKVNNSVCVISQIDLLPLPLSMKQIMCDLDVQTRFRRFMRHIGSCQNMCKHAFLLIIPSILSPFPYE